MYKHNLKRKNKSKIKPAVISRDLTIGISTLVLGCFLLSGLTGLIYEILWTRMIVKVIGSAPFAVSIILTVFMGGLGLGSFIASRMIDRVEAPQRLLRIYALLELAIGGYGIVLPGFIIVSKPLYSILYNELFNHFLLYNVLTLIGCVIFFLFPVTCMGATLPVLCRFYIVQLGHLGTRAGRLYGLNTIGAAVGSLLCGFWLINLWGVWGTLGFAMILNGLIGGTCLFASQQVKTWPLTQDHFVQGSTGVSPAKSLSNRSILSHSSGDALGSLLIFAISGFCAMAYEVIWTRLLGLIIGPTTHSFTIVVTTFIVGIALGSLIFGWFADKTKKPLWLLIFTQFGAAFLVLGISQFLGNNQFFFAKLIYQFKAQFAQLVIIKAGILFGLMLGPTLCLGSTFPLVGKIYTQSLARVGRSIGFAYAINTLGAVLGAFCAGFLLIPWFGKEQSLSLVIGLQFLTSLVIGGYLLWEKKTKILRWIPLGVTAFLGLILCSHFPYWNRRLLSVGKYHRFEHIGLKLESSGWIESLWLGSKILAEYESSSELLYYGDGIGGFTTVVKEIDALGTPEYILLNSGKGDASSRGDMPTQTLLAHLPLLFHPNPREIMVLGLASGITAGEALHYPIERLDIIEISKQVASASDFFIPWNNQVLSNPRTELIIQDGRAHLELTNRTYDVIISEPSNPWMAGLASLFTKDFFLLAKNRLNEEGIFVQWIHSYQMDWPTFALVGRTFSQVFPHSILVTTFPYSTSNLKAWSDYLMIGFKGKNRLVVSNADKRISYAQQSKNITLLNPRVLYRLVVSEDLQKLFGPGPIHSSNWPHLEFAAPKQMYTDDKTIATNILSKRWLSQETRNILREIANVEGQIAFATLALSVYRPFHNMVDLLKATALQKKGFLKIIENYCTCTLIKDYSIFTDQELKRRCLSAQIETLRNNIHFVPNKTMAYNYLGNAYYEKGESQRAIECYQKALVANPESITAHISLGNAYYKKGALDKAISEYKQVLVIDSRYADAYYNLGVVYDNKGELDKAISEYKQALAIDPRSAKAHFNLGVVYDNKGMLDEAISEYKKATTIKPNYPEAYNNLGIIYDRKSMFDEAIIECKKALAINPNLAEAHYNLGIVYAKKRRLDEAITEYKKALAIKSNLVGVHSTLGAAYIKKGMLNEAIIECKKALAIKPNYAEAYNNLGVAYHKKGELNKAISEYKQAIAIKPDYAKAHENLAISYYSQGNHKSAIFHCDKAVEVGGSINPKLLELLKAYR